MTAQRTSVFLTALTLTLAACGAGSDEAVSPTATEPPPTAASNEPAPLATSTVEPAGEPTVTEDAGSTVTEESTEPIDSATPATEPVADTTRNDTEPASVPAELGGRALSESVDAAAAFAGNPFPDLVVDDIGRGTRANLANLLPSDRPVLLWAWAPH